MLDWDSLTKRYKGQERFSGWDGLDLLASAIGDDSIEAAVDFYVHEISTRTEPIRLAFSRLRPAAAGRRCLEILRTDRDPSHRAMAIDLFRYSCRPEHLALVDGLLNDQMGDAQVLGGAILAALVQDLQVEHEDLPRLTEACIEHSNSQTRYYGILAARALIVSRDSDDIDALSPEQATRSFRSGLTDTDWTVRSQAIGILPPDLVEQLRPELESLATDPDSLIAAEAHELLGQIS